MKKFFKLGMLSLTIILLSGCNNKEVLKTCNLTQTNSSYTMSNEYKIYGVNDTAEKVVSVETVTSNDPSVLNNLKEYIEELYSNSNENYGGYDYNIEISDNKLISTVTINYNEMDLEKYIEDNSIMKNYVNDDNKLLIDGIVNIYKSAGAQCE